MNRVIQIKFEIEQLEDQLNQLKKEMGLLRENCNHDFVEHHYMQECTKCRLIESLHW
jgi:hypothetical protein